MSDTHKTDLFELIKSMTMSEKRYFKLFAARHTIGKKNNYIRLFEAVEKQKTYDEKKLIQTENYLSQFAVIKKNLYDTVLKSLDAFNYHISEEREVMNTINQIQILYNKGLYKQCEKLVVNTIVKAKQLDLLKLQYILNEWQLKLIVAQDRFNTDEKNIVSVEMDKEQIQTLLIQQEEYRFTNIKLHHKIRISAVLRNDQTRKQIETIFSKISKKTTPPSHNFVSCFYYYNIHYLYHYSFTRFTEAYHYINKAHSLFEEHPAQKNECNDMFINTIFNKISVENNLRTFEEALKSVKYLKTLEIRNTPLKNSLFFRTVIYELSIYCLSIDFNTGYKRIKELERFFASSELDSANISTWYVVHYQAAFLCIGAEQFKMANKFLNKIVNRPTQTDSRTDIVCYSKILLLLSHYEQGSTDHLEYAVKSVYRFLLKKDMLFAFEKAILKFIKKMPTLDSKDLTIKAFKRLKNELEDIMKDPYERGAMEYFDFISWLESKIYKRPFNELIKEKIKSGEYS